jgi:CheY-like chemotaxis protein
MTLTGDIIIVDDEAHVRRYLSLIVRTLGPVQIHEAPNGEAAVDLLASLRAQPVLILLDVNMPGIDGIETLRRIRAAGYRQAAVMTTSLANRQTIEDAIAAGADHYLRKDSSREDILAAIRTALALVHDESDPAPAP